MPECIQQCRSGSLEIAGGVILRLIVVVCIGFLECFRCVLRGILSRYPRSELPPVTTFPALVAQTADRCGGALAKVIQLLSTRRDILPESFCLQFGRLQDRAAPMTRSQLRRALEDYPFKSCFSIDSEPVASATIAQVHRAIRQSDGREFALKLMRGRARKTLERDCAIIESMARCVAKFSCFRGVPLSDGVAEANNLLVAQADFASEARNLEKLRSMFADWNDIWVPSVEIDYCTTTVLCMEYIPFLRRLDDRSIDAQRAKNALTIGVRALYKMIFRDGFIHCDMHPGNIQLAGDGRVALLDAGFMAQLSETTQDAFGRFFLSIAFGDGTTAASIVRETARRLPPDLDIKEFEREICFLVERVAGMQAHEFQVASFVADLFRIQRKHRIQGTAQFTSAILSLLVYEGAAKEWCPDLDFQQEAVPYVVNFLRRDTPRCESH